MNKTEGVLQKFSYVKVLVAIAVMALLAMGAILLFNYLSEKGEISAQRFNEEREADRVILQRAISDFKGNSGGGIYLPEMSTTLTEICNTGSKTCQELESGQCEGMVNLCSLVPNYISQIPRDPEVGLRDFGTGYWIAKSRDGENFGIVLGKKKISCPSGYVAVPGNSLYRTGDFCTMKYEAKAMNRITGELTMDGCGGFWAIDNCLLILQFPWFTRDHIPVSVPEAYPWVGIKLNDPNSYDAKDACRAVDSRVMSNAEWMTIARNIEALPENWSGGAVGKGYLFQGNSFSDSPKPADFEGEGREKRTFTLTNGEVIWDMAGNVWEWLDNSADYSQQPNSTPPQDLDPQAGARSGTWTYWDNISQYGDTWDYDFFRPSQESWLTEQGIGRLFIRNSDNRVFRRGGRWSDKEYAGLYALNFRAGESVIHGVTGFRCVR